MSGAAVEGRSAGLFHHKKINRSYSQYRWRVALVCSGKYLPFKRK